MENKAISFLDISENKICDDGAVLISKGLQFNHCLEMLWIFGCGFSIKGTFVSVVNLEKQYMYVFCIILYHNGFVITILHRFQYSPTSSRG